MGVEVEEAIVTLPVLEVVLGGKLSQKTLGEIVSTKQGVYILVEFGGPDLYGDDEIGVSLKWRRLDALGGKDTSTKDSSTSRRA